MKGVGKGKKADQISSNEATQRKNRLAEGYTDPKSGGELFVVGNTALLGVPLLGLLASRECPGSVLLETLDRIPQWVKEGRVILSGFHAPLEQQVMRSVLRRKGRVVKVLARGMTNYRPTTEERGPLNDGRMLVLTAYPPKIRRTTRASALERNRLVFTLASETVIPYATEGSPLAALVAEAWTARNRVPSV